MGGRPSGQRRKMHSEVEENQLEGQLRSAPSYLAPTISSSRKTDMANQKSNPVEVLQINPRLKKGIKSQPMKTSQVKGTPAPRKPPLPPVTENVMKTSLPPQVPQEKVPIQTSNHQLQSEKSHRNSATLSDPSVIRSETGKTPVPPQAPVGKTGVLTKTSQPESSEERLTVREDLRNEEPSYYIMWEGPDDTFHSTGITCPLCEKDLSSIDMPDDYSDGYYDDEFEISAVPNVSILPCGHSFHSVCLDGIIAEEKSGDPPCCFCLSCMS